MIRVANFLGIGPVTDAKLLPDTMATDAVDCFTTSGALSPVYQPLSVTSSRLLTPAQAVDGVTSIYKFGVDQTSDANYWFSFAKDTTVSRAQVADDLYERTIISDGVSDVRYTNSTLAISGVSGAYPVVTGVLGLDAPSAAPSAAVANKLLNVTAVTPVLRITFASAHGLAVGGTAVITGATSSTFNKAYDIDKVVSAYVVEHTVDAGETFASNAAAGTLVGYTKATKTVSQYIYDKTTGVVTATCNGHGLTTGELISIKGMPVEALNVTQVYATVVNANSFTYPVAAQLSSPAVVLTACTGTMYPGQSLTIVSAQVLTKCDLLFAAAHEFTSPTPISIETGTNFKGDYLVTPVENLTNDATKARQGTMEVPGNKSPVETNLQFNLSSLSSAVETRAYVYTFVIKDAGGVERESMPSPPATLDVHPGQTVTLGLPTSGPSLVSGETLFKRVYRTVAGAASPTYYLVNTTGDIAAATATYSDDQETASLGEPCPSLEYERPPSRTINGTLTYLNGVVNLPNGMMAGFLDRDIYFCEPYIPHAYPSKYALTVDYRVVGLGVYQNTLVILTEGHPYVAVGSDPASMTLQKVDLYQACVSKRSIVGVGHGVMYASPNGICYVGSQGASLLTGAFFNYETWKAYVSDPATIHAYNYDGAYVGFYGTLPATTATYTKRGGFIFDTRNQRQSFTKLSAHYTAGFFHQKTGKLFLCSQASKASNPAIVQFHGTPVGTPYTYYWKSKIFESPKPRNYVVGQVLATSYPCTLAALSDDVAVATSTRSVASGLLGRRYVTLQTATAHGAVAGDHVFVEGLANPGYNGVFQVTTTPTSTSLTYVTSTAFAAVETSVADTGGTVTPCRAYYVTSGDGFRMHSGFRARNWQFIVVGAVNVQSVVLASSMVELQRA